MRGWAAERLSDEEGGAILEGKTIIIHADKSDVIALVSFFQNVAKHLENNDFCHMHFREFMAEWSPAEHIDIEITVEAR